MLQVHLHFSLEILAQKIARQMYLFRLLFFIFKDPICHYTHVYDCTKCKDMNNLHHILNILFFFIRLFTISHTCTPPYIKSFIRPSSIRWKFDSKKEMKLYTLTTMKMKLKNNWNDKILLESSYRKSKFNTHHFKQIIITWLHKLKKKSHIFS